MRSALLSSPVSLLCGFCFTSHRQMHVHLTRHQYELSEGQRCLLPIHVRPATSRPHPGGLQLCPVSPCARLLGALLIWCFKYRILVGSYCCLVNSPPSPPPPPPSYVCDHWKAKYHSCALLTDSVEYQCARLEWSVTESDTHFREDFLTLFPERQSLSIDKHRCYIIQVFVSRVLFIIIFY